jgi:hypothetical protein
MRSGLELDSRQPESRVARARAKSLGGSEFEFELVVSPSMAAGRL